MQEEKITMKIIGIEERIGEYEDRPYHNVNFHCAEEFASEKSKGLDVSKVKVRYDVLTDTFGKALTTAEILSLVGKYVKFHYDKYKNVSIVIFYDPTEVNKK